MASITSICNLALSNIGKPTINDINEKSPEARACKLFYEQARDEQLGAFLWRCASKTLSLAEVENDKPGLWKYAYEKPVDAVRIVSIRPAYVDGPSALQYAPVAMNDYGHELRHRYEEEGEKIYCNLSPCLLRYIWKLDDPNRYPPYFVSALSWRLASYLAAPLTRDAKVRTDAAQWVQRMQADAEKMEANSVRHSSDVPSDLVASRNGFEGGAEIGLAGLVGLI